MCDKLDFTLKWRPPALPCGNSATALQPAAGRAAILPQFQSLVYVATHFILSCILNYLKLVPRCSVRLGVAWRGVAWRGVAWRGAL